MFCKGIDIGYSLSMWDSKDLIDIVSGPFYIYAMWRNGEEVGCSSG
jgi:hypothetical protein